MKNQSLLTKLIVFASIVSVIPVIIVGVFSYVQSSKHIQEKVNHEKVQVIRQIQSNIEQVLVTVHHSVSRSIDSPLMESVIRRPLLAEDFSIYRELRQELSNLRSYDTKVDEVILLNLQEDWIVDYTGISRLNEHPDHEQFLSYLDLEHNTTWILLENEEFVEPILVGECPYTISLVKKLPPKLSEKYGLAFTNIPSCSLAEMINVDELSDEVMITDEDYTIIVHRDPNLVGQSLVDTHYMGSLEGFNERSGQFDVSNHDESYTVTYNKSDFNDWNYISFNSIDDLTEESKTIGWITFFMITFIILTCSLYIYIISKKLYSPVNNLVSYIEEHLPERTNNKRNELELIEDHISELFSSKTNLEAELKEHSQQMKSVFINQLFTGHYKTSEINEKLISFELEDLVQSWDHMVVCTIHIDNLEKKDYQSHDVEKISFAVKNIVEETIPADNRLPTVWMDQVLILLLGFSDEQVHKDQIYNLTETIQTNIHQTLKVCISIGVSRSFSDIKAAKRGYKEGIEALKHRMTLGTGVIVHFSSMYSGKQATIFDYPKRVEDELLIAIKLGEEKKAHEQLRIWMEKVFKNAQSPREYQIYMMELLNNLLLLKQESQVSFEQLEIYHVSLYEELLQLNMRVEIEGWFQDRLIQPLIQIFQKRKESQFHNLSEKMIDMIHQRYDEEITLEECASKLHYNANYLSSVFKQETNHTFSEYLSMYRFKMAKRWLVETSMTVKEIADQLQYKNSQNFIRSFKKQEDMTPGQYRKKYQNIS
ncbi:AraC family transcriptional regulator [Alkalihalobacillus hemicellulosilyticus]|uniref:Transcriptional regulator n=1 Tax=Halalkalibacter hemicellulosilyticusJCM 9152 TaxID=1236971 RepID=W4QF02_9BACI|nr:AraC family transcriptional regulator [Halalkalibacter hemicellulosilyticus]GAE30651.1 transcriptional regulator [Halalkalibacter hemicellulosilyticusJCM 9152]